MKKRFIALVAICAFALCIGLVGCGEDATKQAAKNFAGTWELSGGTLDGEEISADDIELMKTFFGASIEMTFTEDGKATLNTMGETADGTWKAKDATTIEATFDDSTGTITYKDGKTYLEEDSDKMEFTKVEK